MLTKIYHKKNELLQVEFYQDWKCQQAFDFMDKKDLYIELKKGDCTPIFRLSNKLWSLNIKANIFTPTWYLGLYDGISPQTPLITLNDVLDDIDLSKYIPKDNAVLFLTQEDTLKYSEIFKDRTCAMLNKVTLDVIKEKNTKKLTIFLPHGTQSELQKAEEVAKELMVKYGVKEVNLFALHCFVQRSNQFGSQALFIYKQGFYQKDCVSSEEKQYVFNKIITTNSTGILKPEDSTERLQVIDAKEMLEEYLNENNLI